LANEWKVDKLKNLSLKITKGTTPSKKDGGFSSAGINFIKAESVNYDGRIDSSSFSFIKEDIHNKFKRSQLEENDILFSMAGAFLGKTGLVEKKHLPANTNQALALIRLKKELVCPKYIYYFLRQKSVIHFVNNATSQSAQPNINLQEIGDLNIRFPEIDLQKRISSILGTLDSKIELNHQINQTLEQMAQALFKSWFVDFDPVIDNALAAGAAISELPEALQARAERRIKAQQSAVFKSLPDAIRKLFPSEFEQGELGWIPKGWKFKTIGELSKINPQSWTKKNAPQTVLYVDLANAKKGTIGETIEYEFHEAPSRARRVLEKHDTIIGVVRPANRSFAYVNKSGLTGSTGFAVVRPDKEIFRAFIYLSLTNDDMVDEFSRIADGAAYPAIKPEDVKQAECIYSCEDVLGQFEKMAGAMMMKIAANESQIKCLSDLRDTLLPKLISGEIEISETEQKLEKVLA